MMVVYLYSLYLLGGLEQVLFSISYMGCHPKPIDEVHHFSRWLKRVKTTNQVSNDFDFHK